MVFPDLRKPELQTAWQRNPLFHEFQNVFLAEGMRTLVVLGLRVKDSCCGAILVGSEKRRTYLPGELELLLGLGNQISVAPTSTAIATDSRVRGPRSRNRTTREIAPPTR